MRAAHPLQGGVLLGMLALAAQAGSSAAQRSLTGYRTSATGPVYETWSFSDGVYQPMHVGADSVLVERASQFSVPVVVNLPLGERWSVDLTGAYAHGRVRLAAADTSVGTNEYTLSGLTDLKIRATGRLNQTVLVTFGVNAPTGQTSLDKEEFSAFRVLAAPALGFQAPSLGTGAGGTAGLVLARQLGRWAWAMGLSYEVRGSYKPGVIAASLVNPDYNPSDAVRVSLGGDGFLGQHGMTVALALDLFTTGHVEGQVGGAAGPNTGASIQLGPIVGAEWQLHLAARGFRELTLYAADRYRTNYKQNGSRVGGTSGNYLDAGVRSTIALSPRTGLLAGVSARHQTGLDDDDTVAGAAIATAGLTAGLVQDLGGGYVLQPFVRGQLGRLKRFERSTNVREFSAGLTLGVRF
jgi:hypothetical protein